MMEKYLLGVLNDLFFTARIKSVAAELGLEARWLEDAAALDAASRDLAAYRQHPPAIVVLDLNAAVAWQPLLAAFKSDEILAGVPWLAFGSHKGTELLARAKKSGVDRVVANSTFAKDLPKLIKELHK